MPLYDLRGEVMQLSGADPSRDRLFEPTEHRQRRGFFAWVLSVLSAMFLVLLGFAVAIGGVLAGLISQGQLIALLGMDDPASVQATSAPREVSQPAGEAETVAAATTPAPQAAADEPRVLRDEIFGDWRLVCIQAAESATSSCSAIQQLMVAETGAPIFVWRIAQNGQGGLVGLWQVPETVNLTAGLTLNAGTPQPVVIPFESCGGGSCVAVATLAPDFIETLSATETLSASVVLANQQDLTFRLSSTGLAEALLGLLE